MACRLRTIKKVDAKVQYRTDKKLCCNGWRDGGKRLLCFRFALSGAATERNSNQKTSLKSLNAITAKNAHAGRPAWTADLIWLKSELGKSNR